MSQSAPRLVAIAPAVSNKPEQASGQDDPAAMPYTCVTCARRKVKCDKTKPCSACRRGRLECYYQAPAPRKRKRKIVEDAQERVERYERILKENNLLPREDDSPVDDAAPDATATDDVPEGPQSVGTLQARDGRSRYIDSNIWKILGDDLHPSSEDEDEESENVQGLPRSMDYIDPVSALFYGPASARPSLVNEHPTYEAALRLWNLYATNVDPIIKITHVPSGLKMVQRAAANPGSMSRVTECLLFSIYHFAVLSTSEDDCRGILGISKAAARKKYHDATRKALANCSFLKTTELAVLQAYVLFLMTVRSIYDAHTFWILTGIAVRLGQRIGIHRDAAEAGLNPFDVQMRRRVFWQLLPLDGQAAQLDGTGLAIPPDSWDTKQPLNIDDEDIWPDMPTAPVERKGATDITFCLARTEMGGMIKKIRPAGGNWAHTWDTMDPDALGARLDELEEVVESKYVRYCDISVPSQCLTIAMCRAGINSMRMRVRLPRGNSDDDSNDATKVARLRETRRALWRLAVKVLDSAINVRHNRALDRFRWHLETLFFQWDPLIWLLGEVRRRDPVLPPADAWAKIGETLDSHSEIHAQRRPIDIALTRLTLKVWDQTHASSTPAGSTGSTTISDPPFIQRLRSALQRREAHRHGSTAGASSTPASLALQPFSPGQPVFAMPSSPAPQWPAVGTTPGIGSASASSDENAYKQQQMMPNWSSLSLTDSVGPTGLLDFSFPQTLPPDLEADWAFWDNQFANEAAAASAAANGGFGG